MFNRFSVSRSDQIELAPIIPYDAAYYLDSGGQPLGTFRFDPDRDASRAQAMAENCDVPVGGRVLDFGCGLGTMTAAFDYLGYQATGVDPSPHAVENAVPQARGLVSQLRLRDLSGIPNDEYDLVVVKDVLEHIPENVLHDVVDQLICIGHRVLAIIPIVGEDRKFIFNLYEKDETHITRLTRDEWLGFFPYNIAQDREDITRGVRRPDKVDGTLSLLLQESGNWRNTLTDWRARSQARKWPQLFDRLWRGCNLPVLDDL